MAKLIPPWVNHFGQRTVWSLIYFLIYAYFNILAQSQIFVISLYNSNTFQGQQIIFLVKNQSHIFLISAVSYTTFLNLIVKVAIHVSLFNPFKEKRNGSDWLLFIQVWLGLTLLLQSLTIYCDNHFPHRISGGKCKIPFRHIAVWEPCRSLHFI